MHSFRHFERVSIRISLITLAAFAVVGVSLALAVSLISLRFARIQGTLAPMMRHELAQLLGRDVRIGAVRLAGWNQLAIDNTTVAEGTTFAEGAAFTVPEMTARVDLLGIALHRNANPVGFIDQMTIIRPSLKVNRSAQGRWDFQDVLDRLKARKIDYAAWHAQVVVDNGAVAYRDAHGFGVGPRLIQQNMVAIDGSMLPHGPQGYAFEVAAADAGHRMGRIRLKGLYATGKGDSNIDVDANRVEVNDLSQYLPKNVPITFTNSTAAFRLSALFHNLPSPEEAHQLSGTDLTAEVDLNGVGLHLPEMSAPIVATSGKLRLVYNSSRYPEGSRLEFVKVQAHAASLPLTVTGAIDDINLFDLAHARPEFNISLNSAFRDGSKISRLFPGTRWLQQLQLGGGLVMRASMQGRPGQVQVNGKIHSDSVGLPNFQANDVIGDFHLLPGAVGTAENPTLRVALHADHAMLSDTRISDIALLASSNTSLKQLAAQPQITGALSVAQLQTSWGEARDLWGTYHLDRQGVNISTLEGSVLGGKVTGAATAPFNAVHKGTSLLSATGNYAGVDLAQLAEKMNLQHLSGQGNGTFSLGLNPDGKVVIDSELHGDGVRYQQYQATTPSVRVHIEAKDGAVHVGIPSASAQTNIGSITVTDGRYDRNRAGKSEIMLPLHAKNVQMQSFGYAPLTGLATIDGTLEGDAAAPVLHAQLSSTDGSLLAHSFTGARCDATVQVNRQGISSLLLRNIVFMRPGITVSIPGPGPTGNGFDPRHGMLGVRANVQVHGAPIDEVLGLFQQQSPWQIDGGTEATLNAQLTEDGLNVTGVATIAKPVVHIPRATGTYALPLDRLGVSFVLNGRQVRVHDLQITRGETTLHAQGEVESFIASPVYAYLTYRADHARLQDFPQDLLRIPLPLSGAAEVTGTLQGMLDGNGPTPLTVQCSTRSAGLNAAGLPLGAGAIDLTYRYRPDDGELNIDNAVLANAAFQARSTGLYQLDRGQMHGVQFALNQVNLSALQKLLSGTGFQLMKSPGLPAPTTNPALSLLTGLEAQITARAGSPWRVSGQGRAWFSADGSLARPDVQMGFNLSPLALDMHSLPGIWGTLSSRIVNNRVELHVNKLVAQWGNGQAQFSGDLARDGMQLRVSAQHLALHALSPWAKQLPLSGNAELQGVLSGPWAAPVFDADVQLAHPSLNGRSLDSLRAHLREDADRLQLTQGAVWLADNTPPISVQGELPLGWNNLLQPVAANVRPLALSVRFPAQDISLLNAFLPTQSGVSGTVAGDLQIGGTLAQPQLHDGHLIMLGSAALPLSDGVLPDQLQNIDLRANISNDGRQSQVIITRGVAMLIAPDGAAEDSRPGWLITDGAITIPNAAFATPMRWHWDVYAQLVHMPLAPGTFQVSQTSGLFHLTGNGATPLLAGVAVLNHAKLKQPNLPATRARAGWGTPLFNPRLSLVLQVGDDVKLSKGFFNVPLQKTPLPPAAVASTPPGALPALTLPHNANGYQWTASMLHPGGSAELPGTWGTVTGTLFDPHVYARFEVDKQHLTFPLNMMDSVRNARGRLTFTLAQGARVTMGIPTLPQTVEGNRTSI